VGIIMGTAFLVAGVILGLAIQGTVFLFLKGVAIDAGKGFAAHWPWLLLTAMIITSGMIFFIWWRRRDESEGDEFKRDEPKLEHPSLFTTFDGSKTKQALSILGGLVAVALLTIVGVMVHRKLFGLIGILFALLMAVQGTTWLLLLKILVALGVSLFIIDQAPDYWVALRRGIPTLWARFYPTVSRRKLLIALAIFLGIIFMVFIVILGLLLQGSLFLFLKSFFGL
jgi:hypothetical protein